MTPTQSHTAVGNWGYRFMENSVRMLGNILCAPGVRDVASCSMSYVRNLNTKRATFTLNVVLFRARGL